MAQQQQMIMTPGKNHPAGTKHRQRREHEPNIYQGQTLYHSAFTAATMLCLLQDTFIQ